MASNRTPKNPTLGIIAGGGDMPVAVAVAAQSAGRTVHIAAIKGFAGTGIEAFPHSWVNIGQFGRVEKLFRREGCEEIVIVGSVGRPDLTQVRLDLGAIANLPTLLSWTVGGDNSVLGGIVGYWEEKGFKVVGAHEIAPQLLSGAGELGRNRPGKEDLEDIRTGLDVIAALGPHDVGQALVVARRYVLAVEAAEGTDRMLERCADLRQWVSGRLRRRQGVLVKCAKPGQDRRVDLPAIGPETVRNVRAAGLRGIAVGAGDVMIAARGETVAAADKAGLFLVGVEPRRGR